MEKKLVLGMEEKKATEKVAQIVEVLDNLSVNWGEVDRWGSFWIYGEKDGSDVEIHGFLEGEEELYMVEITFGSTEKKLHVCGSIYNDLKGLAKDIYNRHFSQMDFMWEEYKLELK